MNEPLTLERVRAKMQELEAEGRPADNRAILKALGGSLSTIAPLVRAVRAEQSAVPPVAPELAERLHSAEAFILRELQKVATREVDEARALADKRVAEARQETADALAAISQLELQLEAARAQIEDQRRDAATQAERLTAVGELLARSDAGRRDAEVRAASLQGERDALLGQLQALTAALGAPHGKKSGHAPSRKTAATRAPNSTAHATGG
jgi:chromosome segregation ATPase